MTQFATNADLANRLGLTFSAPEQARADALLELASGIIQDHARQQIEYVAGDTWTVRSTYDDRVRLPERPVVDVQSITLELIGGDSTWDVPADVYYLDRDELVRTSWPLSAQWAFAQYARGWLGPIYQLTVVYDHGFQTIPDIVKGVCLEMVTRIWVNPGSVARETVGNTYTVYDNMRYSPTGLVMTDDEKQAITDRLRRTQASTRMR